MDFEALESRRIALQAELDGQKTSAERNQLGQFATPTALARDILAYARTLMHEPNDVRFLDPALGTGSFYSALEHAFPASAIRSAQGFEIDPHYGEPAKELWQGSRLQLTMGDFTDQEPRPDRNLLICNPPYVRHHHMTNDQKGKLQVRAHAACGTKIAGLAGLYCYFLGLSHAWLAPGAVSGWLIPSEFMDVNYGRAVKRYLLNKVTLLHIHRFDPKDVQFADALVSSAIVWFRNEAPPADHSVRFSFGGPISNPTIERNVSTVDLVDEAKWTRFPVSSVRARNTAPTISDFFKIKRGIATGDNGYFIMDEATIEARQLPMECFRPILPSPRYLRDDCISARADGTPEVERRLFLLDPRMSEDAISQRYPSLWAYLEEGKQKGLHERYLCAHRTLWYAQENRPAAPIICTYLGRGDSKSGRPFRFIWNKSAATVANVYLTMYPVGRLADAVQADGSIMEKVWQVLNRITPEQLLGEGRVYGGGLHKLEPKELANVPVPEIADMLSWNGTASKQPDFFQAAE